MKLTKTLAATITGLALSAAVAAPASAVVDPTPTVTTITLEEGILSIDGPATAAGTGSVAPGATMTVNIGTTTLTDTRGSLLGWTATGSSTDFVKAGPPTYTMPKTVFTWATGAIATTNGALTNVSAGAGGSMGAAFAVAAALPLSGSGSYTYPATVTGLVPVNMVAGDYVGTITQSVV